MSTKGTQLSTATRQNISLAKRKVKISDLIESANSYLASLQDKPDAVPSIASFCLHARISRPYLYELAQTKPEVSDIVDYIGLLQEQFALNKGFNSKAQNFAQFLLKAGHKYSDNQANLTQNNYMNISPDVLKDALKLMNES